MYLQSLIDALIGDTYASVQLFLPELALCGTIIVLLLVRIFPWGEKIDPAILAFLGSLIALWCAIPAGGLSQVGADPPREIFTGMLVYDSLTVYLRIVLAAFAVLLVILSRMTGLADRFDGQDFYALVLGATLGMCIMASANHLMTIFLGVEMASVPSYVLAGVVRGRQRAGEASLKYAVYGAGAAGVMLYGISLLAGLVGTAHLPSIARELAAMDVPAMLASGQGAGEPMVLALAGLMIMAGLAFKLSAVPFHFWCPDVFEGATAEIGAFLSVASKAAALALLVRVALGVTTAGNLQLAEQAPPADAAPAEAAPAAVEAEFAAPLVATPVAQVTSEGAEAASMPSETDEPLAPVRTFVVTLIAIVAAVTCTFGNLAAYGQTNIKRLLAYSTIAHAGYMMMPVAAAVQLSGSHPEVAQRAVSALLFYIGIYLFMNLGAFSIVAFLRNAMHSEEIADYSGLLQSAPVAAISLTVIFTGLIGLPPGIAGFVAKFAAFQAIVSAGGPLMITLLVIAGLNTVISLVYYLRVAKIMCADPAPEGRGPVSVGILPTAFALAVTLPVVILGIVPESLAELARRAGEQLLM